MMITLFCFALLSLLSMARAISLEKASRLRVKQLLEEIARSHRQLNIYAEQATELARLQELHRITCDMHENLGHSLAVINVQLEKALLYHEKHLVEAVQAVSDAKQIAGEALQEVRSSRHMLRRTND